MVKPIASWSSQHQVWITKDQSQLLEQWALYQAVFPKSGMTVAGQLLELAMPAHLTAESESSSSQLRTPKASDGQGGALGERVALARGNAVGIRDQVMDLVADQGLKVSRNEVNILPTPTLGHIRNHDEPIEDYLQRRQDYEDGKTKGMPGASLGVAVRMEMLPTPLARDWKESSAPYERDGVIQTDNVPRAIFNSGEVKLMGTPRTSSANGATSKQVAADAPKKRIEDQVLTTSWGKFEPAIREWETLTRPAPDPTMPDGKDGAHRLSSKFTEWMMGLPDGWITGHGLKRNDELKMAGNGVVPQQAELALRVLLEGIDIPKG